MIEQEIFIPDSEYSNLLKENAAFHLRVRDGRLSYSSYEYKQLQSKLLAFEIRMTSRQIIQHAEYLFPKVGEPISK